LDRETLAPQYSDKTDTGQPLQVGEQHAASLGFARRAHRTLCMNLCAGNRR
jgi:hypothetical protein